MNFPIASYCEKNVFFCKHLINHFMSQHKIQVMKIQLTALILRKNIVEKNEKIFIMLKLRIIRKLFCTADALPAWWRLDLPSKYGRLVSGWRRLMASGDSLPHVDGQKLKKVAGEIKFSSSNIWREIIIWQNKTSNIELSEQRIPQVFLQN